MLTDHFAYIPLASVISESYSVKDGTAVYDGFKQNLLLWVANHQDVLWSISDVFHWIGRIAFPLFCFLLVQGFSYTKSKRKYALRLGIFALISEVPYDMAFNNCILSLRNNNVFFTLLVGLIMISLIEKVKSALDKKQITYKPSGKVLYLSAISVIAVGALFSVVKILDSSYGASGIIAILIIYLLQKSPCRQLL